MALQVTEKTQATARRLVGAEPRAAIPRERGIETPRARRRHETFRRLRYDRSPEASLASWLLTTGCTLSQVD